jgi:hypothetical protein
MRRRPEPVDERWRRYGVRSEAEWLRVCEERRERRRRLLAYIERERLQDEIRDELR